MVLNDNIILEIPRVIIQVDNRGIPPIKPQRLTTYLPQWEASMIELMNQRYSSDCVSAGLLPIVQRTIGCMFSAGSSRQSGGMPPLQGLEVVSEVDAELYHRMP